MKLRRVSITLVAWLFLGRTLALSAAPEHAAPFTHPGILNSLEELQFIKGKINAGAEPWKSAFSKLDKSWYGGLKWKPSPCALVNPGFGGKPDNGCSAELKDASAAYVHALLWVLGGNEAHAQKAAEILDAWSATLQTHSGDNGDGGALCSGLF